MRPTTLAIAAPTVRHPFASFTADTGRHLNTFFEIAGEATMSRSRKGIGETLSEMIRQTHEELMGAIGSLEAP